MSNVCSNRFKEKLQKYKSMSYQEKIDLTHKNVAEACKIAERLKGFHNVG